MIPSQDSDGGLTLLEAWDQLVDTDLLEDLRVKNEAQKMYRDRAIASHGPLPRVRIMGERQPRHPLRSGDYKALHCATAVANEVAKTQFYSRLLQCRVTAREESPAAALTEIPASALPSPSGKDPSRLRIVSFDKSQMAFGRGDKRITYYDVRVWPPSCSPPILGEQPSVGRPSGTGFDDRLALEKMRQFVNSGAPSVTVAARKVIDCGDIDVQGASYDSNVSRLVRKYKRQRLDRR